MYILVITYPDNELHVVYFTNKKKAKEAYKRSKDASADTGCGAILAKIVKEFDPE